MILASSYVELGSDEHAFVIRGDMGEVRSDHWEGGSLVQIPDDVAETGDVLILTCDQWGPFAVTTQLLDGRSEPGMEWEDVVEFSVACSAGGLVVAELVNHDPSTALLTEPGDYRIRVSGRGRSPEEMDEELEEDSDRDPVEHYLIEAWAASFSAPEVLREASAFAEAQREGEAPEPEVFGAADGLAGAAAIGRDVDQAPRARTLGGELGSLRLSRSYPVTRRKLFGYLRYGPTISFHIPSWSFMGDPDFDQVGADNYSASHDDHPDQLSGSRGMIRSRIIEEERPKRRVLHWNWIRGNMADPPMLPVDSVLTTIYTETKDASGQPQTLLELEHDGLPVEWVDDMTAWWIYQLNFLEIVATR